MDKAPPTRILGAPLVRFEPTPKAFVLALAAVAVGWVAVQLIPVLLVIVVALFLVGTLGPAVEWLERKGVSRGWGIGLVFALMAVATLLLLAFTIPSLIEQVNLLVKQEPALRGRIADLLSKSGATAPL